MTNSDQQYRLDRRDLLRGAGATAGVAAAGGIPAATSIDQPIGEAEAIAPLVAAGAGVAIGAIGVNAYYHDFAKNKAEAVSETADKQEIYSVSESVFNVAQPAIRSVGQQVGVRQTDSGVEWTVTDQNNHRQQILSHSKAVAALEWAAGSTKGQVVNRAKDAARGVSVASEISIVNAHNELVNSLSKVIKRSQKYGLFGGPLNGPQITFGGDTNSYQPAAVGWVSDTVDSVVSAEEGDILGVNEVRGRWGDGGSFSWSAQPEPTLIGSVDYQQYLPSNPETYLTDSETPDNFKLYLPSFGAGSVVTPYADTQVSHPERVWVESAAMDAQGGYVDPRYPTTSKSITGEITTQYQPDSGDMQSSSINYRWFSEGLRAVRTMRSNVIGSLDSYIETVYDALDNGQIQVKDVVSARQLYQIVEPREDVSTQAIYLSAIGADGSVGDKVTIQIGQREVTGSLFVSSQQQLDVSAGSTIAAADYDIAYMIADDGSRDSWRDVDIDVNAVNGAEDSDKTLDYDPVKQPTTTSVSESEIRETVKQDQQRYEELQSEIEDLEGGPLGIGGLGSGGNGLLLLVGGGLAAYLLGRDD
jgi:hypothetical protein